MAQLLQDNTRLEKDIEAIVYRETCGWQRTTTSFLLTLEGVEVDYVLD